MRHTDSAYTTALDALKEAFARNDALYRTVAQLDQKLPMNHPLKRSLTSYVGNHANAISCVPSALEIIGEPNLPRDVLADQLELIVSATHNGDGATALHFSGQAAHLRDEILAVIDQLPKEQQMLAERAANALQQIPSSTEHLATAIHQLRSTLEMGGQVMHPQHQARIHAVPFVPSSSRIH